MSHQPKEVVMLSKEAVEAVVEKSGLWRIGNRNKHGFILSPSVYRLSRIRLEELNNLGMALHDCLAGLGRIIHIASLPGLSHGETWKMIEKVSGAYAPKVFRSMESREKKPSSVSSVFRVDMMEDAEGNFYIAEIEGNKKHGFGYTVLARRMCQLIEPEAEILPGVADALAKAVEKKDIGKKIILLYADQEVFYRPEFFILKDELCQYGVDMEVADERMFDMTLLHGEKTLLLDFPNLYHNKKLEEILVEMYLDRKIEFLIPPRPFFGTKTLMAFLRNDGQNERLEAILRSQINGKYLDLVRKYIPPTYLIFNKMDQDVLAVFGREKGFLIKETMASGMKGIAFGEDDSFEERLKKAQQLKYSCVAQKEVNTAQKELFYFTESGEALPDQWYLRIGVHYSLCKVVDVTITARRDKRVHGALDCLQIGTIIV